MTIHFVSNQNAEATRSSATGAAVNKFMSKNLKGRIQLGHMGADGKIILQHIRYKSALKLLMATTSHSRNVDN